MSRSRGGLIALLFALGAAAYLPFAGAGSSGDARDPFPIQRIPVTADKLAQELKAQKQGVFVELSRQAFEDKVRAAAEAQQAARTPPHIVEAHYRAFFGPAGLHGTAQWKVVHDVGVPGILPLQPLNLAIANPRIDNAEALVGDFDGKAPGLLVEKRGEHVVTMDWTSRVEVHPGGYQIEIEAPRVPICDLEIYLPRDYEIHEVSDGCLASGPHVSDQPDQFLWRIVFAQVVPLHLVIRPTRDTLAPRPLLEAQLHTTLDIEPDLLEAEFEFDFKVLHRGVRGLRVAVDQGLDIVSVSLAGMESYTIRSAAGAGPPPPGATHTLLIQLRDELRTGNLHIACRARLPFANTGRIESWNAPGAAIVGDAGQAEMLTVRASPEVSIENWQSGSFVLTGSGPTSDGGQQFTLSGGLFDSLGARSAAVRPTMRLVRAAVDYLVRQQTLWQLGPQSSSLVSRLSIEVTRGRLHQIPLQLPPDWEVEQVEATPGDVLNHARPVVEGNTAVLYVVLKRLLTPTPPGDVASGKAPSASAQLTVRLRPVQRRGLEAVPMVGVPLPVPDIIPTKARVREGGFGIDYDKSLLEAKLDPPPLALAGSPLPADEDCPWGKQLPALYLPFRGEQYRGAVKLTPRGQQLRASCSSDVSVNASTRLVVVQARASVRPYVGNSPSIDVSLSTPLADIWRASEWRSQDNRVRVQAERLTEDGQHWRIHFAQPLTAAHPVVIACDFVAKLPPDSCEVPLPTIDDALTLDGEARIFLSGINVGAVETEGLTELADSERKGSPAQAAWRSFHYKTATSHLTLRELLAAAGEAGADNVSLTTCVDPSGRLQHHFRFTIWREHLLTRRPTVTLPAGAQLVAASADGRWSTSPELAADGRELKLPMLPDASASPSGLTSRTESRPLSHTYEIVYTTENDDIGLWGSLRAPAPELNVQASECQRSWRLPSGIVPMQTHRLRQVPTTGGSDSTEWQVLDNEDDPSLVVFRAGGLPYVGIVLALLLAAAVLLSLRLSSSAAAGRRQSAAFLLLIACLAATGIAVIWLPEALGVVALVPFAGVCLLGATWYVRYLLVGNSNNTLTRGQPTVVGSPSSISAATAVFAGVLLGMVLTARAVEQGSADAHGPTTVYLLTEGSGSTAKERVVAPQELVTQLDEMAHAVAPGLDGIILQSADYRGEIRNGEAAFHAVFKAHCFRDDDKSVTLTIPLADVDLADDDVLVDGAKVTPIALGRPPTAWQFLVKGGGLHTVELTFTIPVRRDRSEEEIEFQVPPLLQSRLTFAAPPGSYYLLARGVNAPARGQQATLYSGTTAYAGRLLANAPGGGIGLLAALGTYPTQSPVLNADLGRLISRLRIRWHHSGDRPQPQDVRLDEAYLWTLRPAGASLNAFLHYDIREGSLTEAIFKLPSNLSIETIEGSILPGRQPLRIRNWCIYEADGDRLLKVEFVRPMRDLIELELRLAATPAAGDVLNLGVLVPVFPGPSAFKNARNPERLLAYQTEDVEAKLLELRQASRAEPARLQPFLTSGAKSSAVADLPYEVFTFRQRSGDSTVARVQVLAAPPDAVAVQDITWRVAGDFADFQAMCKLEPQAGNLCLVECEVPASLQITRVTGKNVCSWSRNGTRLQICLEQPRHDRAPRTEIALAITGWQKHETLHGKLFNVAAFRLQSARVQHNTLRLMADPSVILERVGQGPAPTTLSKSSKADWEYRYQAAPPKITFTVRPFIDPDAAKPAPPPTVDPPERPLQPTFTSTGDAPFNRHNESSPEIPRASLVWTKSPNVRTSVLLSFGLTVLLALVVLCHRWQESHAWLRRTWPEQLAIVAFLIWFVDAPVAAWLLLVAAACRFALLLQIFLVKSRSKIASSGTTKVEEL